MLEAADSSLNQTMTGNDHLLQKIAKDSQKWKRTTARKVDMEGLFSKFLMCTLFVSI